MQACLEMSQKNLFSLDASWKIEMGVLKGGTGESGKAALNASFLACLPTESTDISIEKSLQAIEKLCSSALCNFAGAGSKGDIVNAKDLVTNIAGGKAPSISASSSSLLQATVARLPYFMRTQDNEGKQLLGKEAIENMARLLLEKAPADVSLDDIDPLMTMKYLASESTQQKLKDLAKAVYKRAGWGSTEHEGWQGLSPQQLCQSQQAQAGHCLE